MQQSIQPSKQERKQARKARRHAFWGHLWHELVKMEFITNIGDWLEEFLARVVEKLALFSAIYLIVEVGVPAISFRSIHETAMGIILASPELIMIGAFKMATREIKAGKKQAWGLMICVFLLLILTTLTVLELMVWHWSQDDVNKLLAIRFLASIAYTFCHGILKENHYEQGHASPSLDFPQALADLATRLDTSLSSLQTQTNQQIDTLSRRHRSTEHDLSSRLITMVQSLDTLSTQVANLARQMNTLDTRSAQVDTRLTSVETGQEAHLARLQQYVSTALVDIQGAAQRPVSRPQDQEQTTRSPRSRQSRSSTRQGDSLDTQQGKGRDTQERQDPLSTENSSPGKIIRLSRLGTRIKQPMMTGRVLDYIRANQREPSLGEIQSWGCAKQTAVNSREAARDILRREARPLPQQSATDEQGGHEEYQEQGQ